MGLSLGLVAALGYETIFLLVAIVIGIIILSVLFTFVPIGLWISAISAGVRVGIFTLIGMRLRRVIPGRVINPLIKAHKAGINVTTNQLESHYLAGGNVDRVVNALIAAQRANIELTFERAAAIDLAGRDVLEAVQMSVNPKVIETPFIAGVAMNGIEVKAKARITVRANIERLVGGAGEETVIARVGEGVISTIGSSDNHAKVLENPDMISRTVYLKGLMLELRLKSFQSILLMLISVRTLVLNYKRTKLKQIRKLLRLRLKKEEQWLLQMNRK